MVEFKLPDLGEGIHEGEILKWHVTVGQSVQEDSPLVDVETDKAAVTIPAPVSGRIERLGAKVGDVVLVGTVLAVIDEQGATQGAAPVARAASAASEPRDAARAPEAHAAPPEIERAPDRAAGAAAARRPVPAAPATRRLARELGVDIQVLSGSGPAGRVTPEDVRSRAAQTAALLPASAGARPEAAVPSRTVPMALPTTEVAAHAAWAIPFLDIEPLPDFSVFGPVEREPLRSIRRKVAHKMTTSMILVPHVAHMDEADVTQLEAFRRTEKDRRQGLPGGKLTLLAFVIKAVTAGLKATAAFNASLDPFSEEIIFKKYYSIGIAADTGRGLVVPVIKDTDRKSIVQIATEIEQLVAQARAGTIDPEHLRGGTFTITNVGPLGGTALIPAINYPEVAILGMGRVQPKPVVHDGQIVIRDILPLTLAFDHRVADGADAARFVAELVRHLSDPNLLLLEA